MAAKGAATREAFLARNPGDKGTCRWIRTISGRAHVHSPAALDLRTAQHTVSDQSVLNQPCRARVRAGVNSSPLPFLRDEKPWNQSGKPKKGSYWDNTPYKTGAVGPSE